MSKHVLASVAVLLVTLAVAGTATADIPRMGDQRVGLIVCAQTGFCPEAVLTANEPFHVVHGFTSESCASQRNPLHRFELSIDGVEQHGAIDLGTTADGLCDKLYVFNFPSGTTGVHSFTGCWYGADGSRLFCGTRLVRFE